MGGSADPEQGQFEWFFGPSEDESENSPHRCEEAKANTLTFC